MFDMIANITSNLFNENSPYGNSLWTIYVNLWRHIDQQVVKKNSFIVPDASFDIFLTMTREITSQPVMMDLSMNFWNKQNYSGIVSR